MKTQIPVKDGAGKMEESEFTLTIDQSGEAYLYYEFEKEDLQIYMLPGEWVLTLYNNNKPFVSQKFRVYLSM